MEVHAHTEPKRNAQHDIVSDIIAYEDGEMDQETTAEFFQRMIDDGSVWHLQGSYGRFAQALIESGVCHARA